MKEKKISLELRHLENKQDLKRYYNFFSACSDFRFLIITNGEHCLYFSLYKNSTSFSKLQTHY